MAKESVEEAGGKEVVETTSAASSSSSSASTGGGMHKHLAMLLGGIFITTGVFLFVFGLPLLSGTGKIEFPKAK